MPTQQTSSLSRTVAPIVGWAALLSVLVIFRWYPDPDPDAGVTLTSAWQITQGLVPYRDFFEFHTPGAFYLVAAVIRMFGPSWVAVKFFSLVATVATVVGLDRLVLQFTRRSADRIVVLAAWVALQLQFPLVSYNNYAQLGTIWAAWLLISAWRQRTAVVWFACGVSSGLVVWLLQTRGLAVVVVGFGAALALRAGRPMLAYLAGLSLTLAPFLLWPPGLLWWHLVVYPLQYYAPTWGVGYTWLVIFLLIEISVAAIAWQGRIRVTGFWPLWWLAVLQLLTVWSRADFLYLAMVLWPLPLLLVAVTPARFQLPPGSVRGRVLGAASRMLSLGLGMAVAAMLVLAVSLGLVFPPFNFSPDDPFGLRVPFWDDLAAAVRERTGPDDPIAVTPVLPNLYFFAQRRNATRYHTLLSSHPVDAPLLQNAVRDLERVRPPLVVRELNSLAVQLGYHTDGTIIDRYLDRHYRVAKELEQFAPRRIQLLERIAPAP